MKEASHRGMVKPPLGFHQVIELPEEYWVFETSLEMAATL